MKLKTSQATGYILLSIFFTQAAFALEINTSSTISANDGSDNYGSYNPDTGSYESTGIDEYSTSTGNQSHSFAQGDQGYINKSRVTGSLGAYSQISGTKGPAYSPNRMQSRASASQTYTFSLADNEASYGAWNLNLGYDGTLSATEYGSAGYSIKASAYLTASNQPYSYGGFKYMLDEFSDSASVMGDEKYDTDNYYGGGYYDEAPPENISSISVDNHNSLDFFLSDSASDFFDTLVIDFKLSTSATIGGYDDYMYGAFSGEGVANFYNSFTVESLGGVANNHASTFGLTPVPIPASIYFFGAGLMGMVSIRKRLAAKK